MKRCELCGGAARMYCESDQASLCWDCDEKVHRANFLVAKHYRSLLCQVCQSPTPWKASGPKLVPTVSICDSCFDLHNNQNKGEICDDPEESHAGNEFLDGDGDEEDYSDDEEEEEEEDDDSDDEEVEDEEEDGENQVVPWSVTSPSPPVASSSSSEASSRFYGASAAASKRMPENNADHDSDDEIGCSSSHLGSVRLNNDEGNSMSSSLRPSKRARRDGEVDDNNHNSGQSESRRSMAIIGTLKRLQSEIVSSKQSASATILGICRLSSDHHSR